MRIAPLALAVAAVMATFTAVAQENGDGTIYQVDPIVVPDELPESPIGPDKGYAVERSRAGTKTDASLLATPRSVSVITRERLEDQAVDSIAEALRYTAGVQPSPFGDDNRYNWFNIRGFRQDWNSQYLDGLRLMSADFFIWSPEPYGLARIEVFRGPASTLYGLNPPGGLVNLVSKRPNPGTRNEIQLQYGTHDHRQAAGDFSGALGEDIRYRIVGLAETQESNVDYVESERYYFAPSLTWDISDRTELTVLASAQKDDMVPELQFLLTSGVVEPNPNGEVPYDRFVGEPGFDTYQREQYHLGYQLSHRLNGTWTLQQNLRLSHMDLTFRNLYSLFFDATDPDRSEVVRYGTYRDGDSNAFVVDNRAIARWALGDTFHTTLFGVDYQRVAIDYQAPNADFPAPNLDLYDPVYGSTVNVPPLQDHSLDRDQLGVYLQDQMYIGNWVFLLGGRHDSTHYEERNRDTGSEVEVDDSEFTWTAGAVYQFDNGVAPYASYAESYNPLTTLDDGEPFEPETGQQFEIGVKYQPHGYDALFTVAAYELRRENMVSGPPGAQVQTGEVRARGLELQAVATLWGSLDLIAAITVQDVEITSSEAAGEEGNRPPLIPERQASLWATYTLTGGPLSGLGFGAGIRYVGDRYNGAANRIRVPSYTLYDAALFYTINDNLRFQLNVTNLTDEEYVAGCQYFCYWGNDRQVIGTVEYSW